MPSDPKAADFGRKLRDARERRGISLRQISNATKISMAALEALERNDVSRLPGGIFSRAFVRSYAAEAGLDPEQTVQEFISQFPHESITAGHPTSSRVEDTDATESNRQMASTFLRLILLSVPLAGVVLYFGATGLQRHRAVDSSPPPVAAPSASATNVLSLPPSPAAAPPAMPAVTALSADEAAAASAPRTHEPVGDRLTIGLSVTRPCWVSATVDGQKTIERLLQAGDQRIVEVRRELVLTAGDAAAIKMTLNGAAAKPLGKSGEVVTARLNLTNFRDYLSTQ